MEIERAGLVLVARCPRCGREQRRSFDSYTLAPGEETIAVYCDNTLHVAHEHEFVVRVQVDVAIRAVEGCAVLREEAT